MKPNPTRVAARWLTATRLPCDPGSHGYAFIDPKGKVHEINKSHHKWAIDYIWDHPELRAMMIAKGYYSDLAMTFLLEEGWIRVANVTNISVHELRAPSKAAWLALVSLMTQCVAEGRLTPETPVNFDYTGAGSQLPMGDFVRRFGGRKYEDALFEAALARVASPRTAGILQAPPKLVEAVTEWAQATFAERSYQATQNRYKEVESEPKDSWVRKETEDRLKALKRLERIPSPNAHAEVSTTFDFTEHLDGWRYKHLWDALSSTEQRELRKGPLRPFTVTHSFSNWGSASAGWSVKLHELRYWMTATYYGDEADVRKKHQAVAKSTRHELQHITQNAIGAMADIASGYGGLPKKKVRQKRPPREQAEQQTQNQNTYFKSDIEYQTAIADAVDNWNHDVLPDLQRWLDDTDLSDRNKEKVVRHVLRVFVYEGGYSRTPKFPTLPRFKRPDWYLAPPKPHRFFESIYLDPSIKDNRWKNAVATFYKEIAKTTKLG